MDASVARFWDLFIEKSKSYGIRPAADIWHVRYAEQYIKAHPNERLATYTPAHVDDYLRLLQNIKADSPRLMVNLLYGCGMADQRSSSDPDLPCRAHQAGSGS